MIQSVCTLMYVSIQSATERLGRLIIRATSRDERGQASAEYALVLMAAAGLAILFGTWAVKNGNVQRIFTNVLNSILGDMGQ